MRYKQMTSVIAFSLLLLFLISCGSGDSSSIGGTWPQATGAVTVAWDEPKTYTDNTTLTVAGYYVYYGPTSLYYTHVIDVGDMTLYTLNKLAKGTYYIAVTAYDSLRNESDFSQPEIVKVIQ